MSDIRLWATLLDDDKDDFEYILRNVDESLRDMDLSPFIKMIKENEHDGCVFQYIFRDCKDDFAVVMAFVDDEYRIKIGKQPRCRMMLCDYDDDWDNQIANNDGDFLEIEEIVSSEDDIEYAIKSFRQNMRKYFECYKAFLGE